MPTNATTNGPPAFDEDDDTANAAAAPPGVVPDEAEESAETRSGRRMPLAVIRRLSLYARALSTLEKNRVEKVSSKDLGDRLGFNSAQVRKDLANFGQFGIPGYGYGVADLRENIRHILGTDRKVRLALVGVGNLGSALLSYRGFHEQGIEVVAAFDSDKRKVGSVRAGVRIYDSAEMERRLGELAIDIVILAVPEEAAQPLAEAVVRSGVAAIVNFVPKRLVVSDRVMVQDVDLALEIESLSYFLR